MRGSVMLTSTTWEQPCYQYYNYLGINHSFIYFSIENWHDIEAKVAQVEGHKITGQIHWNVYTTVIIIVVVVPNYPLLTERWCKSKRGYNGHPWSLHLKARICRIHHHLTSQFNNRLISHQTGSKCIHRSMFKCIQRKVVLSQMLLVDIINNNMN